MAYCDQCRFDYPCAEAPDCGGKIIDTDDTRDFVPHPTWMERDPTTGEVP